MRRIVESGSHVIVALLGKIKGESGDRAHLLPSVELTSSGIGVRASLERLIATKQLKGFVDGPAISDESGRALTTRDVDALMHEVLITVFDNHSKKFPADINTHDQVREAYHAFRSPRRASDTRALEKGVSPDDINIVNRWHSVEASKGGRPGRAMRYHYAQFEQLLRPFLRYTAAM